MCNITDKPCALLDQKCGEKEKLKVEAAELGWPELRHESMKYDYSPKLNMAIPRHASDSIEIDFSRIFGIATCHLHIPIIKIYIILIT